MGVAHKTRLRLLTTAGLLAVLLGAFAAAAPRVSAQQPRAEHPQVPQSVPPQTSDSPDEDPNDIPTIFFHGYDKEGSRLWLSGQVNVIFQWHRSFHAPYTGANSLLPKFEHGTSYVMTLYTGYRLGRNTGILFDLESAAGHAISKAFGLAGFTNLDVVRNPTLGAKPYMARLMIHQIIPLSRKRVAATRGPLSLATELPARRLEVRFGKFGMADFFDVNSIGSDSHLQFLNWAVDNNAGYDYAADTRGYTWGALVEYQERHWGLRFAETLMPKIANGIHLDADLRRAHSENVEFELRGSLLPRREGTLRLLGYANHGNMGSYRDAINAFLAGRTPLPDVTAHPRQTRLKYGFGANFEQPFSDWFGVFGRFGWNEGKFESFAYTEVNQTVTFGAGASGRRWHRKFDRAGVAVASNALSGDHRRYLALGGQGFLLGDGRLNYGRELILEGYYTYRIYRGVFASLVLQHIHNPGYNRDRGPVLVPALRLHADL